jgi:hypothetical protein
MRAHSQKFDPAPVGCAPRIGAAQLAQSPKLDADRVGQAARIGAAIGSCRLIFHSRWRCGGDWRRRQAWQIEVE